MAVEMSANPPEQVETAEALGGARADALFVREAVEEQNVLVKRREDEQDGGEARYDEGDEEGKQRDEWRRELRGVGANWRRRASTPVTPVTPAATATDGVTCLM